MNAPAKIGFALFEIADRYRAAFFDLADSDVPDDAIDDTLGAIEGEFTDKALAVAAFVQNLEAEAKAVKDAAKRMADRARVIENKAARLRDYLRRNMEATGIPEIKCPQYGLRVRMNPYRVVIDDETAIDAEFIREKIIREADKVALKQALQDGKMVAGAHLVRDNRLEIR